MICKAVDNLLEQVAMMKKEEELTMMRLGKTVALVAFIEADMLKRAAQGVLIPIPVRVCHNAIHLARSQAIIPPTRALIEYVRDKEAVAI